MKKIIYTVLAVSVLGTSGLAIKAYAHSDERKAERIAKIFNRFDANGDSLVSMDEFLSKPQAMFKKVDTDGDGMVSLAEAQENFKNFKGKRKWKHRDHDEHDELHKIITE